MPHIDYVREAGSEGIELVMWLIARGAMSDVAAPSRAHRFYPRAGQQHGRRPPDPGEHMTINVALAGAGAFGIKHLDAIKLIPGVKVISLISRELGKTQEVADKYGIAHVTTDLADSLAIPEVDAVILCTPTQMHASQTPGLPGGRQARAGGDPAVRRAEGRPGRGASAAGRRQGGDVRPHAALQPQPPVGAPAHRAGEFNIQQMDVQTYFFRRTNMNALGQPRSWTDHLLWHHAAHTVDLFAYQARSPIVQGQRHAGPDPPDAGHRDGHEHPAQGGQRRDLHAEPELQQRRPAGHLLPLHRRHRHLHRALRRPVQRQGREDRRVEGRRVDERHRAAGPRVLRRHPRRAASPTPAWPRCCPATRCCTSWSSSWRPRACAGPRRARPETAGRLPRSPSRPAGRSGRGVRPVARIRWD
jgi:hypothetical protein